MNAHPMLACMVMTGWGDAGGGLVRGTGAGRGSGAGNEVVGRAEI